MLNGVKHLVCISLCFRDPSLTLRMTAGLFLFTTEGTEVYFFTADLRGLVFIFIQSVLLCVLCGCLSYRCFSLKVYFIIETERSAGVCGKA